MSKVAIVYWSGTGNTQQMAESVADGVKQAGGESVIFTSAEFSQDKISEFNAIAFGCPASGSEELEESEFSPMFESCEPKLKGKKIGLFGSYGWGDGEWMRNWEEQCKNAGANLVSGYVICNDAPDNDAMEECIKLGKALV